MKPTENQVKLIKAISEHVSGWQNTNDITSPSHFTLNAELMASIMEELPMTEYNVMVLDHALDELFIAIKNAFRETYKQA